MNKIPYPLQNILQTRHQFKVLLEDTETKELEDEFLKKYPRYEVAGTFGEQALDRLKEIATDPMTYKVGLTLLLVGALAPATLPLMVAGGLVAGTYSAAQQAQQGNYGAAAVDLGLGALPFGTKGGRAAAIGKTPQGTKLWQRQSEPGRVRPNLPPIPPPRPQISPDVLANLRQRIQDGQNVPEVPFRAPTTAPDWTSQTPKFSEPITIEPWQASASEAMGKVPEMSPWQKAELDMRMANPLRQGMPGTRVRSDVPGGSELVSPYGLSKKDIARIEKFGNAAEKDVIARAKQRQVGRAIGGRVGEQLANSESPIIKAAIDNYYKNYGPEQPSLELARAELRKAGVDVGTQSTSTVPKDLFTPKPPQPTVVPTLIVPKQPHEYSSDDAYIRAVEEQTGTRVTPEEANALRQVYADSVRAQEIASMGMERLPSTSEFNIRQTTEAPGPLRIAARKAAAAGGAAAEAITQMPDTLIPEPPPAYRTLAPAPIKEPFARTETPHIPSRPSYAPTEPLVPSTPTSAPRISVPPISIGTPSNIDLSTILPTTNAQGQIQAPTPVAAATPAPVSAAATAPVQVSPSTPAPAIAPTTAPIAAFYPFNIQQPESPPPQLPTEQIPQIPEEPIGQRRKKPFLGSDGKGRGAKRDTKDLVAMVAPSSEELMIALKRGQLGAVSGYYQLA